MEEKSRNIEVDATLKNLLCIVKKEGIIMLKKSEGRERRFEQFWGRAKELRDFQAYRSDNAIIIKSKNHIIANFIA